MKKWYRIRFAAAFFLLCACFCAGCGEGSRPQKLDLGQLQNENASYGLSSLPFGQSVADAEKSLGCSLGEIALSNNGMDTHHIEDGWEYDGLLLDANLEFGEDGFASISFTVSESDEDARDPLELYEQMAEELQKAYGEPSRSYDNERGTGMNWFGEDGSTIQLSASSFLEGRDPTVIFVLYQIP